MNGDDVYAAPAVEELEDLARPESAAEVFQREERDYPVHPLPVEVCKPVRTQAMPIAQAAFFTITLPSDGTWMNVVGGPDPKRQRVWMNCDVDIILSTNALGMTGMHIHAYNGGGVGTDQNIPATFATPFTGALYARVADTAIVQVGTLGVCTEYWAD